MIEIVVEIKKKTSLFIIRKMEWSTFSDNETVVLRCV